MAANAKLVIFAALYFISNIECAPVENDIRCSCEDVPLEETELLMRFLKDEEEKQGDYPIYPGILSPQVKCSNCIEYSRKKRKTQPESGESTTPEPAPIPVEVASEEPDFESVEDDELPTDYGFPDGYRDKRCPTNTLRQGQFCVPIPEFLLKN